MKSWTSSSKLNEAISGYAIITPPFPPYFSNLASISPNVLDTLNRPGNTLTGPINIYYYYYVNILLPLLLLLEILVGDIVGRVYV